MLNVKIIGPGCANCRKLEAIARQAASSANFNAEFVKVSDMKSILDYDLISTPGLAINDKLVCSGRIPSQAEILGWMTD